MFTVCLRYSRDKHEAEEILQQGFIKVFSSLHQYRNEGSLEGWIRRVIVTSSLQHLRSKPPLHAVLSTDHDFTNQFREREEIESGLSAKELLALVQSLPLAYRMVFNLYVFEGYQHKEIAQLLGISEGTSKSNLFDARRWLKERILASQHLSVPEKKCL
jgi:RNA polymerase sigma-70 factor (ECF subfamily)